MGQEMCLKLDDSWTGITEIIPFGYGRVGRRVIKKLKENFEIPFVIDNNPKWQEQRPEDAVQTFGQAKDLIGDRKIVVLTTELPYLSIKALLEEHGYAENLHFCILSRFLGEWYMKCRNQLCVSKIDTIITSRCTLPCPHCAMYIHECKNKRDYPLEELCRNFDRVFSVIDYVMEYSLFGGEPLIYRDLAELVDYLMRNYGGRIGRLVLISNGNAAPPDAVMDMLEKYGVMVAISDYTSRYDYKNARKKLTDRFDERGIEYSFHEELVWKDMGYPHMPANVPDREAERHFKACGHSAFCINNGILYYCDAMFGAEANTGYPTQPDDVVNIREYVETRGVRQTKARILQYIMGGINEGGVPQLLSNVQGCRRRQSGDNRCGFVGFKTGERSRYLGVFV